MTNDFRQLLVATLPKIRGIAITKTRNRSEADDLLQQTAVKALNAEHQFTLGTNFKAWLCRIMLNEFISSIRRKSGIVDIDVIPEEMLGKSGDQEDKLLSRELLAAMNKIPESQRVVMIMICASGMTYEEAAAALRCSIGTIKSRLWRARRAMQAFMLNEKGAVGSERGMTGSIRSSIQVVKDPAAGRARRIANERIETHRKGQAPTSSDVSQVTPAYAYYL